MAEPFQLFEGRIIGIANRTLFPELAAELGTAFGTWLGKGSIVAIARDYRADCHMIKRACTGGIMASGVDIIDMHSTPTSTLQFVVRKFGANAGISFTGSHYIDGELAIKLIDEAGNEIDGQIAKEIMDIFYTKKFIRVSKREIGNIETIANSIEIYQNAMLGFVNRSVIEAANFNIVLDCSLGPTSLQVPNILSGLATDITTMNTQQVSPQEVLPDAKSLQRISKTVEAINAELGIVLDVEGVKIVGIDNLGKIVPPEDLTALIIWEYLKEHKGNVVLSNYFTRRFDEAFTKAGANIIRVADSPGNIGRVMSNERAIIGTTDNGKLFNPIWGPESDGTLTALTLLEILAKRKTTLRDLIIELEGNRCKAEDVATSNNIISLPSMLNQRKFFDQLMHKAIQSNLAIRDTLIGYKIAFLSGWAHFMVTPKLQEVYLLCETYKSEELAKISDSAMDLAKIIIKDVLGRKL
jgi:phosphomannomutase